MSLSLIVAMTKNRVIGKDNQMPWHLPADLAWFRQNTTGKPVIMGRKTFESIGRPLPKRTNIVLSRQPFEHDGVIWKDSLESAVDFVRDSEEIMLIGGGQLFNEYLSKADRLYLTEIKRSWMATLSSHQLIGTNGSLNLNNIALLTSKILTIVDF